MTALPPDYSERAYAAVLGKLIGVYLGRPFEGWTYQRIMRELGPIEDYVHERLNCPLVVTDDDVAGTFTFIRALEDHGTRPDLTSREIGETWLNYLVERRSILWWGGNGNSTEHTAWLNLKRGIAAPASGSIGGQWPGRRRADRRADLHRRMGDRRRRKSGPRRPARGAGGQSQPRRGGGGRGEALGGDGSRGVHEPRRRTPDRSRPRPGLAGRSRSRA